jgi:hypothetical protein
MSLDVSAKAGTRHVGASCTSSHSDDCASHIVNHARGVFLCRKDTIRPHLEFSYSRVLNLPKRVGANITCMIHKFSLQALFLVIATPPYCATTGALPYRDSHTCLHLWSRNQLHLHNRRITQFSGAELFKKAGTTKKIPEELSITQHRFNCRSYRKLEDHVSNQFFCR